MSRSDKGLTGTIVAAGIGMLFGGYLGGRLTGFPFFIMGAPRRPDGELCSGFIFEETVAPEACDADMARRETHGMLAGAAVGGAFFGLATYYGFTILSER